MVSALHDEWDECVHDCWRPLPYTEAKPFLGRDQILFVLKNLYEPFVHRNRDLRERPRISVNCAGVCRLAVSVRTLGSRHYWKIVRGDAHAIAWEWLEDQIAEDGYGHWVDNWTDMLEMLINARNEQDIRDVAATAAERWQFWAGDSSDDD